MAVVIVVAAAILLTLAVVVLVAYLARHILAGALRRFGAEVFAPSLIRALPPRAALGELLPAIYGPGTDYEDVLSGLLGGPGRDPGGRDTAVSRSTSAHVRLRALDSKMVENQLTWTHEFAGSGGPHKFLIFATHDRAINRVIGSQRVHPLFEAWLLDDEEQLEDFVPIRGLELGITYVDVDGRTHSVEPTPVDGQEVTWHDYDRFIRLHRGMDRHNLRIVQVDLWDLADVDHVVESVRGLSVRACHHSPLDREYISWTPPHPCFVREVVFDVSELALDGQRLVYLVVPYAMNGGNLPSVGQWQEIRDQILVPVDSWMLPGHSVTLLWRSTNGAESDDAAFERW